MWNRTPEFRPRGGNLLSGNRFGILLAVSLLSACSPLYVLRAGLEEARILSRRRPIVEVAADPQTDSVLRRKLELVLQARTFADRQLRLNAGESFTTYSWIDHDTLLMVLSAVRKDRFEAHTWWFPIVGDVPYKGYFDFKQAYDAAEELEREGFDTHVRPSGAFSTLGWFNDPLLNTVVRYNDIALVSTVVHELLHNTLFISSRVSFNESFANFVGDRGAIEFFCTRDGPDSPYCTRAQASWDDNLIFGAFLNSLVNDLEALYARKLPLDQVLPARETIFNAARQRFKREIEPKLQTNAFRGYDTEPLNNATLIATRLYYDQLHLFEAAFEKNGKDLRRSVDAVLAAVKDSKDPFAALTAYLAR